MEPVPRATLGVLFGAWLSLVERSVRDREAAGSNPVAPTIFQKSFQNRPPALAVRNGCCAVRTPASLHV